MSAVLTRVYIAAILAIFSLLLVELPHAGAQQLAIEQVWARASIGTKRPGVVFMVLRNQGLLNDVLTGIETPIAGRAEVHNSTIVDGVASMAPAGPVVLPARGEIRFAPGGLHIMLMALKAPLVKGSIFKLTLIFDRGDRVVVDVPVLSAGALGPQKQ